MAPRIEIAEVVSFKLRIPDGSVERLVDTLTSELSLELSTRGEVLLSQADGDSFLRFRSADSGLVLTEIALCNDERGLFFQRVLGALMVDHKGDLETRLVWNASERNTQGEFAEVKIRRGVTTYPGLQPAARGLRNTLVAASAHEGGSHPWGEPPLEPHAEQPAGPSTEEREVEQLLARAKEQWEEYLRLKGSRA